MNQDVTIVAYHYVRDLKNSRYPGIKGLDLKKFESQLQYFQQHYQFITIEQLSNFVHHQIALPNNPILLTFDDGYIEHFTNVFPLLYNKGIQGCFYLPGKTMMERKVLDINKIHFTLANVSNIEKLKQSLLGKLDAYRSDYNLENTSYYYDLYAIPTRFDNKDVVFIKRILQAGLPEAARSKIVQELFQEFVGITDDVFYNELYLSKEQVQVMLKAGMHIGQHCYEHYWLNKIDEATQRSEIEKGLSFLEWIGAGTNQWSIAYPYGAYNQATIRIVEELGCNLGFTADVDMYNVEKYSRFEIPRYDTNDLPIN